MGELKAPFLSRVVLRNYKSIKHCDVALGPLTLLVGPNGSGKSNFLDAIRFVSESLRTTVQQAIDARGQIGDILRRTPGRRESQFSVELSLRLPDGSDASYAITVGNDPKSFLIEEEKCSITLVGEAPAGFVVKKGKVTETTIPSPPAASDHELFLTRVSGVSGFGQFFNALRGMRFYNIEPRTIANEASRGKPTRELQYDGRGALFTAQRLFPKQGVKGNGREHIWDRIEQYLEAILGTPIRVTVGNVVYPQLVSDAVPFPVDEGEDECQPPYILRFQMYADRHSHVIFGPTHLSDGTLRAFGVLLSLFQCLERSDDEPILLVGLEEPESALHPAAAGVLFDALREASHFTQVLVTTHSADLLDVKEVDSESLLVVESVRGESVVARADEASKSIMRDRLSTAGELLRQNQLRPADLASGSVGVGSDSQ